MIYDKYITLTALASTGWVRSPGPVCGREPGGQCGSCFAPAPSARPSSPASAGRDRCSRFVPSPDRPGSRSRGRAGGACRFGKAGRALSPLPPSVGVGVEMGSGCCIATTYEDFFPRLAPYLPPGAENTLRERPKMASCGPRMGSGPSGSGRHRYDRRHGGRRPTSAHASSFASQTFRQCSAGTLPRFSGGIA